MRFFFIKSFIYTGEHYISAQAVFRCKPVQIWHLIKYKYPYLLSYSSWTLWVYLLLVLRNHIYVWNTRVVGLGRIKICLLWSHLCTLLMTTMDWHTKSSVLFAPGVFLGHEILYVICVSNVWQIMIVPNPKHFHNQASQTGLVIDWDAFCTGTRSTNPPPLDITLIYLCSLCMQ